MLLVLIALIILAWLAIQTTLVQNFLVKQVTRRLSKDLNTTVSIKHVDFALFNKMLLEGTLVKDQHKDTLLYAGTASLRITDWFFFKDKIELEYIGLKDATIHLNRTDSIWNYKFLIDYFGAPKKTTNKSSIDLNLKQIELDNVLIAQKDKWRGEDLYFKLTSLDLDAKQVSLSKKNILINSIDLVDPVFIVYNYTGRRPPLKQTAIEEEEEIIDDPNHLRWNAAGWSFEIDKIDLKNGIFESKRQMDRKPYPYFDGQYVQFSNITGQFKNIKLLQDSITAIVSLKAKERSGFEVKKLQANMRMHPEAMEFANLDLQTNRSRLHNFFAMRYNSFDDMNEFISKVRMEGNFDNAQINSDDIAFFAPAVKTWKKQIQLTGIIKGSVENLNGKNLIVKAGNNTYLSGNISLAGLPDIDKTYIDFEADNFRTSYRDALAFVPQLKNVTQPRLELLQYLNFKGNFTGFLNDFVTYGSLETNLGTLVTDLNLKLNKNNIASYSGSIKTAGFALGRFVDNEQIGKVAVEGKINGSGFNMQTINAKLDGQIHLLEFNNYPYRNIAVKGTVAKRLFNGELTARDPNLDATLIGLIDFSKDIPQFDFNANIGKADLKKLNIAKDDIQFNGKFRFNFKGNNIDNFLGSALVYESSVYKDGLRIPFDSLYLESKIVDNNKVITVLSNEFDAVLAGEFSIRDLPAAFQTFLNKYYPSYISPSKKILQNQNFSFVVTTKKVDPYIGFVHKDLSGFNYSSISGRINSKANLLDVTADIPRFNYKNFSVYNLNLKGVGTFDSLVVEGNIADVYVSDSLHFPLTTIKIRSANDISDVSIKTSASQTLNAANISAEVQTLRNGTRIRFNESNFDINGKNWTIAKDGELVLSRELVSADGVRIFNAQQEILVTTVPSDIGNTNDIRVDLKKINIGDFAPFVVKKNRLEGLLSGTVDIIDPFGKIQLEVIGEAEQFRLDDDSVGRVKLNANYNQRLGQINFNALSANPNYNLDAKGLYIFPDSTRKERIDITADLKNTKIDLLEKYLASVFSELTGLATGQLRIAGPTNDLKYTGKVQLRDGAMRVAFTNVLYKIPTANINFTEDLIDFGTFTLEDQFGNRGYLTRGRLFHQGFNNLAFDFALNTSKMLVLATSNNGKDPFFGNVIAEANMTLTGPLQDMRMDITAEPADTSNFYINTSSGRESGEADFIVWKVYGKEMQPQRFSEAANLTVTLDVTANNYATMYVILDELTGDIIKANGRGNLKMRATTNGEFTIRGRYDIDRGDYNFSFESLLRKPFKLRENVGNYIQWSGDPANATIKVDAEYEAENVRFSDLGLNQFSGLSGSINENVKRYRGKVLVVANLTGQLAAPNIKFQIELPANSDLKNDLDATAILTRIQNDENELNKQVAFLVVFNSFGPYSTSPIQGIAGTAFEGIVVNSISGVLSNTLSKQFSNIFQKIFNDKSLKVNFNAQLYSGTNLLNEINRGPLPDRTNLNLSIEKNLFNERLTFTFGSAMDFGLNSDQARATKNSTPFLPDITAEWKITPDGKLVLTFFYRDSYNYLSGAGDRQNRSGASISYRHEFDHFSDLFRSKKRKPKLKPMIGETKIDSTGTK